MSSTSIPAKDLTKEAPRSPHQRIDGYVILARTIDKCHAAIAGNLGDYHFDCPLDNMIFGFKGVKGPDFKKFVETGASDAEIAGWLDENGDSKTPTEVREWSDDMEKASLINDPEKKDYFIGECTKLGLDPFKSSLFDWLEADDKASFAK